MTNNIQSIHKTINTQELHLKALYNSLNEINNRIMNVTDNSIREQLNDEQAYFNDEIIRTNIEIRKLTIEYEEELKKVEDALENEINENEKEEIRNNYIAMNDIIYAIENTNNISIKDIVYKSRIKIPTDLVNYRLLLQLSQVIMRDILIESIYEQPLKYIRHNSNQSDLCKKYIKLYVDIDNTIDNIIDRDIMINTSFTLEIVDRINKQYIDLSNAVIMIKSVV